MVSEILEYTMHACHLILLMEMHFISVHNQPNHLHETTENQLITETINKNLKHRNLEYDQ